jgi:voltage-gated potassium channel
VTRKPPVEGTPVPEWKHTLHEVIFEADTAAGKTFDVVLLVCILLSIIAVLLESVTEIAELYGAAPVARIPCSEAGAFCG